jgi:predicted membrane channel-forming protein YqfA (hemolysin III family)
MSEYTWLNLVYLLGVLALVGSGFAYHRIEGRFLVKSALLWAGIILILVGLVYFGSELGLFADQRP